MKSKLLLFVILLLVATATVSAVELPPEQLGKDLDVFQECDNCTSCNFTRITYGGEIIFSDVPTIKNGTHYSFTILKGNLTTRDMLTYCYACGNAVEDETGCNHIPITYNGHALTTELSIMYLGLIMFLIFLMGLLFFVHSRLPTDVRDNEGYVLEVSKLAYLRPVVKGLIWILLTSITFIASNVAIAYLDTGIIGEFLFAIARIMIMSNLIILPLAVIFMIQRIALSKDMLGLIERGVQFT